MICGIGAGILIATWPALLHTMEISAPQYIMPTLGASGAVFGVLLAYSLTWPDRVIMLIFPPIPIKAIYFIPFLFFMQVFGGPPNISHVGHLGGVLVGWIALQRMGIGHRFGLQQIKHRYRRYKMRRDLQAAQKEDRRRDEHTYH
jgi:membrane associated rhomboid family serine protease